ncbi:hypothetical protein [Candidatus Cyrtobacter comes]|nr:hypothetical protein [Candidatus Cyrtobacter comes]
MYVKPWMSVSKRYRFIALSFVLSCYILLESVFYNDALKDFAYKTCVNSLVNVDPMDEYDTCKSYTVDDTFDAILYEIFILITVLFFSPFWGVLRLAWRIYHRKIIKEMGATYEYKLLDDVLIVASIFWPPVCYALIILFTTLYIIYCLIYSAFQWVFC